MVSKKKVEKYKFEMCNQIATKKQEGKKVCLKQKYWKKWLPWKPILFGTFHLNKSQTQKSNIHSSKHLNNIINS